MSDGTPINDCSASVVVNTRGLHLLNCPSKVKMGRSFAEANQCLDIMACVYQAVTFQTNLA